MSFDYFNNSMLAFGNKLTRAFATLEKLSNEAEANIAQVISDQEIFDQYINRNYQVPRPVRPDSPVRSDELFDIVNDKEIYLRRLEWKDNRLYVEGVAFNRANNRITKFSGNTKNKEGYVYYKDSTSNQHPEKDLIFEKDELLVDTKLLFQYRIDKNNNIDLIGDISNLSLVPFELIQYKSMSKGKVLATNSSKYTSDDYQAVCVIGKGIEDTDGHTLIELNGKPIYGTSKAIRRYMGFAILYLKPNDVITGKYSTIFKINYEV